MFLNFSNLITIIIIVSVMSSLSLGRQDITLVMQPQIAKGLGAKNWVSTWVASPQLSRSNASSNSAY